MIGKQSQKKKYPLVNWADGMPVNKGHFTQQEDHFYGPVVRIPVISSEPQYLRTPAIQERRTGFRRFQHYGTRYRHLGSPSRNVVTPLLPEVT